MDVDIEWNVVGLSARLVGFYGETRLCHGIGDQGLRLRLSSFVTLSASWPEAEAFRSTARPSSR